MSAIPEHESPPPLDEKEIKLLDMQLKIWEKAVETQMHFNDMSAKARQHGIALVVVIEGFAFFLLSRNNIDYFIQILGHYFHITFFITILPPIVLWAVSLLDLGVYHKMLRGAVVFGQNFEDTVIRKRIMLTYQGMTRLITIYSQYDDADEQQLTEEEKKETGIFGKSFGGKIKKTAGEKIQKIYCISIGCLTILPVILLLIQPDQEKLNLKKEGAIKYNINHEKNSAPNL